MFTIPVYTIKTIEDFFPEHCVCQMTRIDTSSEGSLFEEERALIQKATSKKRQREFTAGRYAAHQALQTLGIQASPITRGPLGEPMFPAGITGSISHSKQWSIAVVSHTHQHSLLGVDIEYLKDTSPGIMKQIASPKECAMLGGAPDPTTMLSLFSAKESLYKMLAPRVQQRFWYHDAEMLGIAHGCIELQLVRTLHEKFQKGWSTTIRLAQIEDSIVSYGASS